MARSRLTRIGTIHSRTTGLLRAGAMKEEDKPLWFDVYEAFPPKDEPRFDRPESKAPIRSIFYEEDVIRAKYHKDHRNLPLIHLDNTSYKTQTQKFIAAYQQLAKEGVTKSELYATAVSQTSSEPLTESKERTLEEMEERPLSTGKGGPQQRKNININLTEIFKE